LVDFLDELGIIVVNKGGQAGLVNAMIVAVVFTYFAGVTVKINARFEPGAGSML